MGFLMTLFIGLIAGVIAKFLHPGKNEPKGFILTMLLGVVGAFVFTFLGQALGFYGEGDGAGLIGATLGAVIVLVIWNFFSRRTHA
ncbi:MAG: GlsB/YeaQ/YmgE family stress response membrane protein [Alphaproteobacteria bacterium]|nr:GlsB/YeaQ/YmgE family stress response membrane protein [Alphaproteobacteria bacterium]MBU2085763.1 GlsB/YeaQ/YmgE family stress response membrane protein [Alphaproteobacteria bacterium]MBU2144700.1 GlsB/YeaQ/YmgE family stress response membrane protein [Alphaproteobacteria bacterium]MBU2197064.1 GlsB/YeaQ/YmgE family stress response membrane protein [Alphaproteobacteria bacterium]